MQRKWFELTAVGFVNCNSFYLKVDDFTQDSYFWSNPRRIPCIFMIENIK